MRNYASRIIKELKTKPNLSKEKTYFFERDKKEMQNFKIQKEILLNERELLRKNIKNKVKEIIEIESVDLSKLLQDVKSIVTPKKTSRKEINEIIKKELANLKQRKRNNKEDITKIEITESIINSTNLIYFKSKNPEACLSLYKSLINYIRAISNIQFGNNNYKKNLFLNEALKQIENQFQASKNIEESVRKINQNIIIAIN